MEEEFEEKEEVKIFGKHTIISFSIFLVIAIVFFILLSAVNPPLLSPTGEVVVLEDGADFDFGVKEILYSLAFAILMAGFLLWIKSIAKKNAYLGAIIGLVVTLVLGYAFSLKFKGTYSTAFIIVAGLAVIVYLAIDFLKYRKDDRYVKGEFDDS